MEINVWIQLFVRAVTSALNQFVPLNSQKNQSNGGALPNVPANAVDLTSTSKSAINPAQVPEKQPSIPLQIKRNPKMTTATALFGTMVYNGTIIGVTMERTAVAIPEGVYRGCKRDSAHFDMRVVGIDVPNRTNIECHPANYPSQLLGCIAIGDKQDGDALDNSRDAFDRMMLALPESFSVEIVSL